MSKIKNTNPHSTPKKILKSKMEKSALNFNHYAYPRRYARSQMQGKIKSIKVNTRVYAKKYETLISKLEEASNILESMNEMYDPIIKMETRMKKQH